MSISSLVVKCDKLTLIEFLAKFKSFVTARTDFDGAFLLEHAVLVETYIFLSLNFFTISSALFKLKFTILCIELVGVLICTFFISFNLLISSFFKLDIYFILSSNFFVASCRAVLVAMMLAVTGVPPRYIVVDFPPCINGVIFISLKLMRTPMPFKP